MPRNEIRIYRSRSPVRTALTVFFALLAAVIVLTVAVFFGFKRYIVYTSDGVRLDIPWLQEPEERPVGDTDPPSPALPEEQDSLSGPDFQDTPLPPPAPETEGTVEDPGTSDDSAGDAPEVGA